MRRSNLMALWALAPLALLTLLGLLGMPASGDGPPAPGDLNWTVEDSPVVLNSSIEIARDDTLEIGPGVEVRLDPGVGIQVKGTLRVTGTEGGPVSFGPNATGPLAPASWEDVRLHADSQGNHHQVRWAVFQGANSGLLVSTTDADVLDCTFDTCKYGIIARYEANLTLAGSSIVNCTAVGVEYEQGADGLVVDCTFQDNRVGLLCYINCSPEVRGCSFDGNYHHLSFFSNSSSLVSDCVLSNARAEHFECYQNCSPLLEDVTIQGDGEARVYLNLGSRPRLVGGTPLTSLTVDTADDASYAVALRRITVRVTSVGGQRLGGANVTIVGASGDPIFKGATDVDGRIEGALMSFYSVESSAGTDRENPHNVTASWRGYTQRFSITPQDLDDDLVLHLEMETEPPEPAEEDGWLYVALAILVIALMAASAVLARRGKG